MRRSPRKQSATQATESYGTGSDLGTASQYLQRARDPIETRRGLPGDPKDDHSRYLEAAIDGIVVACLYLPNGNPQPGPKFDYKLAWFKRLNDHARSLYTSGHAVVLAGDFNVVPTDFDIYDPKSWKKTPCCSRKPCSLCKFTPRKAGLIPCELRTPMNEFILSGTIFEIIGNATPACE